MKKRKGWLRRPPTGRGLFPLSGTKRDRRIDDRAGALAWSNCIKTKIISVENRVFCARLCFSLAFLCKRCYAVSEKGPQWRPCSGRSTVEAAGIGEEVLPMGSEGAH